MSFELEHLQQYFPASKFNKLNQSEDDQEDTVALLADMFLDKLNSSGQLAALDELVAQHRTNFDSSFYWQIIDILVPKVSGKPSVKIYRDNHDICEAIERVYNTRKEDLLWQYVLLKTYKYICTRTKKDKKKDKEKAQQQLAWIKETAKKLKKKVKEAKTIEPQITVRVSDFAAAQSDPSPDKRLQSRTQLREHLQRYLHWHHAGNPPYVLTSPLVDVVFVSTETHVDVVKIVCEEMRNFLWAWTKECVNVTVPKKKDSFAEDANELLSLLAYAVHNKHYATANELLKFGEQINIHLSEADYELDATPFYLAVNTAPLGPAVAFVGNLLNTPEAATPTADDDIAHESNGVFTTIKFANEFNYWEGSTLNMQNQVITYYTYSPILIMMLQHYWNNLANNPNGFDMHTQTRKGAALSVQQRGPIVQNPPVSAGNHSARHEPHLAIAILLAQSPKVDVGAEVAVYSWATKEEEWQHSLIYCACKFKMPSVLRALLHNENCNETNNTNLRDQLIKAQTHISGPKIGSMSAVCKVMNQMLQDKLDTLPSQAKRAFADEEDTEKSDAKRARSAASFVDMALCRR